MMYPQVLSEQRYLYCIHMWYMEGSFPQLYIITVGESFANGCLEHCRIIWGRECVHKAAISYRLEYRLPVDLLLLKSSH